MGGIVIFVCALCSGLRYCASTLAWAGTAAANWLYASVLMPIGSSVQSLARIIFASLLALLQNITTIFTTAGHGVASVFQAVWANALLPAGQGIADLILAAIKSTASGMSWCVSAIRDAYRWFTQL